MQIYRTKYTRLILPNQIANPNLQNQIYQTKPTKPNLPNQTCQRKLTKPNLPNKANMDLFLLTSKAIDAKVSRSVCLWQCLSFFLLSAVEIPFLKENLADMSADILWNMCATLHNSN